LEFITAENFDLVINAAGSADCKGFDVITDDEARRAWMLMVEAPRRIIKAALPNLLKNNGTLINVRSLAAQFPIPYLSLYNSAKAALSALSTSLMDEYPQLQIIDLQPGDVKTKFSASWKIEEGKVWSKTAHHLKNMIDVAPSTDVVVKKVLSILKRRSMSGRFRAGEFVQTMILPLFARIAPTSVVNWARRVYMKR
jgi:short-subunit dehydrogenase